MLTLLLSIPALAAGPLKVTGRVVDTKGEVLIGVTIREKVRMPLPSLISMATIP